MKQNLLSSETSPYLLQHKDNPVNWRPWNARTLRKALQDDKPILLSIGYASCHWCHVMAHECFEDNNIAALMNDRFINIKVDREERPDIDAIYQSALSLMGRQGGWPLTMFLTPDGKPFWGGTYFPPTQRYGLPAFTDVLEKISTAFRAQRQTIDTDASALSSHILCQSQSKGTKLPTQDLLQQTSKLLHGVIDPIHGGTLGAPKFPQVPLFEFLWHNFLQTGDQESYRAVITTLDNMSMGGIYDHLGGGFSRYATDEAWLIPHFEKMLYDNAQLIGLLSDVWLQTKNPIYAARVTETIKWCLHDLTVHHNGLSAFASGYDADSEGGEGAYYLWTQEQIDAVLGDHSSFFKKTYGVSAEGNWEGKTILIQRLSPPHLNEEDEKQLSHSREKLLKIRQKRPRPALDDKVLADCNAMMIAALTKASRIFDCPEWLEAGRSAFTFVCHEMTSGEHLCHSWCKGQKSSVAFIDDYAHMILAALDLHEATGEKEYLSQARSWAVTAEKFHWDDVNGGYFLSAKNADDIIGQTKNIFDHAVPSGNGLMARALARLHHLTHEPAYREKAMCLFLTFSDDLHDSPISAPCSLSAYDLLENPIHISIYGMPENKHFQAMLNAIYQTPIRNRVLQRTHAETDCTAQICVGQTCLAPISDPDVLRRTLSEL